jgi:RHS repeat-associated protein
MANQATLPGLAHYVQHTMARWIVHPDSGPYALVAATTLAVASLIALSLLGLLRRKTVYSRRFPRLAWGVPGVLVVFFLFGTWGAVPARADLVAGPNGAGVPVDGTCYFHHNQVNSASLVTDPAGNLIARVEYEPFGRIYQPGSSGQDVFRPKYGDQELERDSGLYYFKARYYDPDLGRFLTPDRSLGAHPLHNSALNRYAYVGNNPVSYTDPSGKFTKIGAIVGMIVATAAGALIAGTEGKILSDTTHAFDNWS